MRQGGGRGGAIWQPCVQVIYEPKDRGSEALSRYVKELVDDGNHVVNTVETGYGLVSMKELNSRTQGLYDEF